MKKDSKVLIYVALSLIITGCLIMINTIVSVTKYDKDLYAEVYEEYDEQIKEITKTEFIDEEKIEPKETEKQYEVKAQISEDDNRTIGILKIQKLKLSYPVIKETTEENKTESTPAPAPAPAAPVKDNTPKTGAISVVGLVSAMAVGGLVLTRKKEII